MASVEKDLRRRVSALKPNELSRWKWLNATYTAGRSFRSVKRRILQRGQAAMEEKTRLIPETRALCALSVLVLFADAKIPPVSHAKNAAAAPLSRKIV